MALKIFLAFLLKFILFVSSVYGQSVPEPPRFSMSSGYYGEPFELEILTSEENIEIFYTLDGSIPDPENVGGSIYEFRPTLEAPMETRIMETFLYESPLTIDDRSLLPNEVSTIPSRYSGFNPPPDPVEKATVIRAIAVRNGNQSDITSGSYFVGDHFEEFKQLPVLSIMVTEEDFWGYERGIYVPGINNGNYLERGREWERPIHIEFIDENGDVGFSQQAGIRIHGGTSRNHINRSLRVYARSDYGVSTIEYPLFPNRGPQVHKRLKLRKSGQDQFFTYFRDALMSILMIDSEVTAEDYRPAHLFLNGEYWGITNIRERFDHHYVERNFGIPRDEVQILSAGTNDHYAEYQNYIYTTDPDSEEYFEKINDWINLNSFLDLKIAEIFFGRWDMHWEHWRDGSDPDSKWRWVMWDFDVGMTLPEYPPTRRNDWTGTGDHSAQTDFLKPFLTDYRTGDGRGELNREFSSIMKNNQVRGHFLNRLALMMNSNLSNTRILDEIERLKNHLEPVMPLHIKRWSAVYNIGSMQRWNQNIEHIRDFSSQRQEYVFQHAVDFFELDGTAEIQVEWDDSRGTITIEEMSMHHLMDELGTKNDGYWTGRLFRDIPIKIKANAEAGFIFSGWQGLSESSEKEITIILSDDAKITAQFEPIEQYPGDDLNPEPHLLSEGEYLFDYWSRDEPEGQFPANMIFLQSQMNDPGLDDPLTTPYFIPYDETAGHDYHEDDLDHIGYPYRLTRRTRINALEERGISMINTGRGRDLGGVVLALDTRDVDQASVSWTAETIQANSRVYHVRMRYRTGIQSQWSDLTLDDGTVVEFQRKPAGIESHFNDIVLPQELMGLPYVQLKWKYYFTGERLSDESGQRDEIRIDNIRVGLITDEPDAPNVSNAISYPNPFDGVLTVQYELDQEGPVTINIYNVLGQRAANYRFENQTAGVNSHQIDFSGYASGLYYIQIITTEENHVLGVQYVR